MTTTLMHRRTRTTTCQALAGSLLAPCPNLATDAAVVGGQRRAVCPAHALQRLARARG